MPYLLLALAQSSYKLFYTYIIFRCLRSKCTDKKNMHTFALTHTQVHLRDIYGTEEKIGKEKGFQGRLERTDRGSTMGRNRESVSGS